ncbi:MAG: HAD-IC family P-type ATPase [Bacilli bacterium]|nr:HAD-IC family P-type ATPase [Bacilli bacterium]
MIRYNPDINIGLNQKQVNERIKNNLVNYDTVIPTKSKLQIIYKNVFNLFNSLNFILALAIILVNSYRNLLFMGVVISNTLISTIQELRAKKIIDRLSILSKSKLEVIRSGKIEKLSINEIVLDDLIILNPGSQVVTDSIIVDGTCEVNESFISGEANTIYKKEKEKLISGSFIVSGRVIVRVNHIGLDNYTAIISKEAKYIKKVKSDILSSLNKILKIISIIIVPLSIILFFKQLNVAGNTLESSVVNTVAAMIGMIPEGLILLISTVFAIAIIRLYKYKVLVQELYSIESLARIDTLCLDKTGTITEGVMEVKDIIKLDNSIDLNNILSNFSYNFKDVNQTLKAIQAYYKKKDNLIALKTYPFSSDKKFSGVRYKNISVVIGALETIQNNEEKKQYEEYSKNYRALTIAISDNDFIENDLPLNLRVIGFILIEDILKKDAKEIINYFQTNNVDIKIISGDNPVTVSNIAKKSGVIGYDKYIDIKEKKNLSYDYLVNNYNIFGRVNPKEKKELILALKRQGKIVAMTGDGVNDVLALKEADCSISFKNATEAARNVSQIILINSDFSSVKEIVKEGRRSINNIERSSSLFLVKTIFATILAIIFIFLNVSYPFKPIQLTLTSVVTIGLPSFILALEPNYSIVKGKYLTNVISKALPAGLTMVINIILILIASRIFNLSLDISSTMCVISNATIGFLFLYDISKPFNKLRTYLFISMILLFILQGIFLSELYYLVVLTPLSILIEILILLSSILYFKLFQNLYEYILKKHSKFFN